MAAPKLRTEAARAGKYPSKRFNQRERKLLESVSQAVMAGKFTTQGGDAIEVISAPGVEATDVVVVSLQAQGATPRTILKAVPTANTITVTMSGDPSTDHVIAWVAVEA
jgi:uncharacterized protein with GYD domain